MNYVSFLGFFVPSWARVLAYLVIVASVVGSVYFTFHKYYVWAYDNGSTASYLQWQTRESKELATANVKILELQATAKQKESDGQVKLLTTINQYEMEKQREKEHTDSLIASINDNSLKLRDKYAATCQSASSGAISSTTTNSDSNIAEKGTQFSKETASFLLNLTAEADDIVGQLNACQELLLEDRETCGVTTEPVLF